MNARHAAQLAHWARRWPMLLCALSLSACGVLGKPAAPPPAFYTLDGVATIAPPAVATANGNARASTSASSIAKPTLIINPPQAAAGFDSQRMVYVRQDHRLEYFAHSEWVDTPARMLGPLLVSAAEHTGAFVAVVQASGEAAGDLRLQHNFQVQPSQVELTLRVYLTDEKTHRVLAWQVLNAQAPATSDTQAGGVAAANQAVQAVQAKLGRFLVNHPQ